MFSGSKAVLFLSSFSGFTSFPPFLLYCFTVCNSNTSQANRRESGHHSLPSNINGEISKVLLSYSIGLLRAFKIFIVCIHLTWLRLT